MSYKSVALCDPLVIRLICSRINWKMPPNLTSTTRNVRQTGKRWVVCCLFILVFVHKSSLLVTKIARTYTKNDSHFRKVITCVFCPGALSFLVVCTPDRGDDLAMFLPFGQPEVFWTFRYLGRCFCLFANSPVLHSPTKTVGDKIYV